MVEELYPTSGSRRDQPKRIRW